MAEVSEVFSLEHLGDYFVVIDDLLNRPILVSHLLELSNRERHGSGEGTRLHPHKRSEACPVNTSEHRVDNNY